MTKKVFFSIFAVIILLMTGLFYFQLQASPAKWCKGEFTWACDLDARVMCEGEAYDAQKWGSSCDGETCIASYEIWCADAGLFLFEGYVVCRISADPDCSKS